ncbi:MAG TPA: fibronectin type III domain-containing protein, partial [Chitinophaga sp.]
AGANIFFFQKNDPPLLNLPICGSRVEKRDPQFLTFNWSSRNTPSPFAENATEYIFSLYEIKPKGSNPDYIVRSARPIYAITTESNTLVYGPGEPLLIDSMEYVWVVQARDKSGRDLYSNQGLSQSCRFTYLGNNPFAANNISKPSLSGKATGERSIRLSWLPAPVNAAYQVEAYRLQYRAAAKDGVEFDWITKEKQDTGLSLNSLEPGRMYEARLQWRIAGVYGPYSDLVKVTTDPLRTFNCGDGGATQQPSNTKPLLAAIPGMIIRMGHFDVLLTEVKGSDGTFTGKGRVVTPGFGIGLLMEFKGIFVNTDLVVTRGEMQAVTEGIDKFVSDAVKEQRGGDDVGQVKTGDIVPDITTKLHIFTPAAIKVNTDEGTITLTDSQTQQQEVINYKDKGKTLPLVLEDADGNLYNIDKNGKVTAAGKRDSSLSGNAAALAALNTLELDKGKVTFAATTGNKYAFDTWKPEYAAKPVLDSSYESLSGGKYHVSAKAVAPGEQEIVTATLENASADTDPAKLKFVSGKGIAYPFERNGNTYKITITGGPAADAQEVFAVYPKGSGKYASMGKLLVSSYTPKQKKVVLVPLGANTPVPVETIRSSLEKAYAKIGLTYTVETDESFRIDTTWDLDHNQVLQDSKSAFLGNGFTGEEKALKKAYKKKHTIDDNAVYLFLVNEAALTDGDLLGKMPRQSQLGFIFMKGAADEIIARTVSHEIGHGDYTLEHTFSAGIGLSKGGTDNLMDYNSGYGLLKYQWDVLHDPGNVWGIFEGDDESAEATINNIEQLEPFKNKDGSYTFLTPAGKPLTVKGKLTQVSFVTAEDKWSISDNPMPLGTLYSFELDGKFYEARKIVNSNSFGGYADTLSTQIYVDELSARKQYQQPIIGIPCIKDYNLVFRVFTTDYLDKNVANKEVAARNKGEGTEQDVFFLSGYLESEGQARLIYAKMKALTKKQLFFLDEYALDGNMCGIEALYAFRAAHLVGTNPGLFECLGDAEQDVRGKVHRDYLDALAAARQVEGGVAADATAMVNPNIEKGVWMSFFQERRPDDKNFLKYMYNLLVLYQQYLDNKPTAALAEESMGTILDVLDLPKASGRTCLLRNLPLPLRVELLKRHTTWKITTSKESLMCDLIETTPDDDIVNLLIALRANNYDL